MPQPRTEALQRDLLRVGLVQFRPVWLRPSRTIDKMIDWLGVAAAQGAALVVFPETALAGYPYWICRTNGAAFEDPRQRTAYGQFLAAAVERDSPEIKRLIEACRDLNVAACLGMNERGARAGRGTIFCTALMIDPREGIIGTHRKLMPTHDERLCWGQGDARDLKAHKVGAALVGTLNCWENWMPLARYALYASGEEVHISLWPGNPQVCRDAARFVALEGRVWSLACSGVLALSDVPADFEFYQDLHEAGVDRIFEGGSLVVSPTGEIVCAAEAGKEDLLIVDLPLAKVREARHSFDPSGHYARSDVFNLEIVRRRAGDEI